MDEAMVPRRDRCSSCRELLELVPAHRRRELLQWEEGVAGEQGWSAALNRATTELARLMDAERCTVLAPMGRSFLRIVADSEGRQIGDLVVALDRYPELEHLLLREEPVLIAEVESSHLLRPVRHLLAEAGFVSILAVPLQLHDAASILRISSRTRSFQPVDQAILTAAAHLMEHVRMDRSNGEGLDDSWRALALHMADGLLEVAVDGRIVAVDGPIHDRLGVDPEALLGRNVEDFLAGTHVEEARREFMTLLQGKHPTPDGGLHWARLPGAGPMWLRFWGSRVEAPVPRVRLTFRREASHEASQRPIEQLLGDVPVPLLLLGPAEVLLWANRAAERLLGQSTEDLVGRPLSELVQSQGDEDRLILPGERRIPVRVLRAPQAWENGESTAGADPDSGNVVALLDLRRLSDAPRREAQMRATLERQLEELEGLRRQLRHQEAAKSRFLAAAAHELKSPLTVIQSYLEIFLSDMSQGLSPEQLSFLEVTYDSVGRLQRLVGDLVDLAALESGKIHLDITRVEPIPLMRAIEREMRPVAERAGLQLLAALPDRLPAVRGDADRIQQVLRSLLDNALKYTPEGGSVTLRAGSRDDTVVLELEDTGVGIPEDQVDTIFDEFVRIPHAGGGERGAGLGLTISRRIARALGGQVRAASTPGKGSTFSLHLPRWPEAE